MVGLYRIEDCYGNLNLNEVERMSVFLGNRLINPATMFLYLRSREKYYLSYPKFILLNEREVNRILWNLVNNFHIILNFMVSYNYAAISSSCTPWLLYCKETKALSYFTSGRASVKTLNCSDSA